MTLTLTSELAHALDRQGDMPLPAVHPSTGRIFFLISEDQYKLLKPLFENDPRTKEVQIYQLQQMGKRAGWDDPAMEAYDRYDDHRAQGLT
jgi:hypothetical protein